MRSAYLLAYVAAFLIIGAAGPVWKSGPSAPTNDAAETRRVRAHFDSVLTELATRAPIGLTSVQQARRTTLRETLREYRDRGRFPHNYDFPGRAVPSFVDRKTGTLCAVAYLLASTGRRDIVDRVASTDNNVRASQLAADTALARWLDANGLTLAEAARIQPTYDWEGTPSAPAERARKATLVAAAPIVLGGSALASLWTVSRNADGHQRVANVLGLASGALAIGTGAVLIGTSDAPRGLGAASVALGGVSVALATRAIRRHGDIVAAERDRNRLAERVSVAPTTSAGTGLTVSMRF
jgi:hypothetical protein